MSIEVPTDGRPLTAPGSGKLVGIDGNVFSIIGTTMKLLGRAGASQEFVAAYISEAESGDYDHAIYTSIVYLDAEADA